MAGLDKWEWHADPEFGDAGWLRMGVDGSHQWQQPKWDVLVSQVHTDEGVRFQVRGSVLDGAMYPTVAIAMTAVGLMKEERGEVE